MSRDFFHLTPHTPISNEELRRAMEIGYGANRAWTAFAKDPYPTVSDLARLGRAHRELAVEYELLLREVYVRVDAIRTPVHAPPEYSHRSSARMFKHHAIFLGVLLAFAGGLFIFFRIFP